MANTLLISPVDIVRLDTLDAMANREIINTYLGDITLHQLYISSFIQFGLEEFTKPSGLKTVFFSDQFFKDRFKNFNDQRWSDIFFEIFNIIEFNTLVPNKTSNIKLVQFLTDLFYSLENKLSFNCMYEFPEKDTLKNIDPKLSITLINFLNCFKPLELQLPGLTRKIERKEILVLRELLKSDFFIEYSEQHNSLLYGNIGVDKPISRIKYLSHKMANNTDFISLTQKGIIYSAKIVSKLIELKFGKIFGKISEIITKILEDVFNRQSQIVFYNFVNPLYDIVNSRLKRALLLNEPNISSEELFKKMMAISNEDLDFSKYLP